MDIGFELLNDPLVQAAALPFTVALLSAGLLRLAAGPRYGRVIASAAIALGLLAAYLAIAGIPPYPPRASDQKLAYAIVAGLMLGILLDFLRPPRLLTLGIVLSALLGGLGWLALPRLRSLEWATLLLFAAVWLASAVVLVRLSRIGERASEAGTMLAVAAVGAAPVAFYGASLSLAQLCGALAAASAGFILWNWPVQRFSFGTTGVLGAGGTLALLAGIMALYTKASALSLVLLVPVFFADGLVNRIPLPRGRLGGALRPILLALVCAIPAAAAIAAAHLIAGRAESGAYY